jgi:hypothetical protein
VGSQLSGTGELEHRGSGQWRFLSAIPRERCEQGCTGGRGRRRGRGKSRVRIVGAHLLLAPQNGAVIVGAGGGDEDAAQQPAPA